MHVINHGNFPMTTNINSVQKNPKKQDTPLVNKWLISIQDCKTHNFYACIYVLKKLKPNFLTVS